MNQRLREGRRKLAIKLRDGGIPLDVPEPEWARDLIMTQQGSLVGSSAFDLRYGRTGFAIDLSILFNKTNIAITSFALEVPWHDPSISWLEDPREMEASSDSYRFPGTALKFSRAVVINHVANRCKTWAKGKSVEGLLLGFGSRSMTNDIGHGKEIPAFLNVTDQFGHVFSFDICLWADRSWAEESNRSRTRTKRKLFESRDLVAR